MGKVKAKKTMIRSLSWLVFGLYIITLYRIAVLKYMPVSIIGEQFCLVDIGFIRRQLMLANFIPLRSIAWYAVEAKNAAPVNIVGNVITFIPLGFFLQFISENSDRLKRIALIGFASSLSIEAIQLISGLGRFDVDDIILNTFGVCLGFFAYRGIKRIPEHSVLVGLGISLHDVVIGALLCLVTLFNFLLLAGCRFF